MTISSASLTRVKFWGVRGSIPVPGSSTVRYGGNTSCVEVRAGDEIIVLDAGTGIRPLGLALEKEFGADPINLTLLITHAHWDHIHGLPFFTPAHHQKNHITVYGPDTAAAGLREILESEMATPFFPVALHDLAGKIDIRILEPGELTLGGVRVRAALVNHPGICVGYRLFTNTGSIAFLPDHEPYDVRLHSARGESVRSPEIRKRAEEERALLVDFLNGSDLLILDAQYTDGEYEARMGWGHGSLRSAVALARDTHAHKLVLFHHDPNHDDGQIDKMLEEAKQFAKETAGDVEVEAAREGTELSL
ncbi:MAG: MBL fold metallo-hydrolase [Chthoniobacterales bacterium]